MTVADVARLDALSKGFRARYLRHDDLTAQMRAWCEAFPSLVRMESLGPTPEGRPLWVLTVGPDPAVCRPSVWIDGNMHAGEYAGSSVALAIAEDLLRMHLDPAHAPHGLPAHVVETLRGVRAFVMPRMSPDGAEAVLTTGRYVRSVPRETRGEPLVPRWRHHDLNDDGLALVMRQEDPAGEFVESDDYAGLLVPRRLEDPGPYYKIYPEGTIEGWDGHTVPSPHYLQEFDVDLNRNFPFAWAPEERQAGAGRYAASEPESRAVVDFVGKHPEIFAWLNLHTFGGVFIRPMGDKPDTKMVPEDLAVWRQVGQWAEQCTGYPVVSGFEEFLYEPDTPLHGDLIDYGYCQRGALAYVCELWDLFHQLGIPRKKPFVEHYSRFRREDYVTLARWDHAHNGSRIVRPWHPFQHPQLGPVEIGGLDPRVGIWNPPYDKLGSVCAAQSAAFLRVAAMAPRVRLSEVSVTALGDGVHRIVVDVENVGYLPSYVLASARALAWNRPLRAEVVPGDGVTLLDLAQGRRDLGHLEGWGRGPEAGSSLFHLRSRGSGSRARAEVLVRGEGDVTVRVIGTRVGTLARTVRVGGQSP